MMKKSLLLPVAIALFVILMMSYIVISSRANMIFPHGSEGGIPQHSPDTLKEFPDVQPSKVLRVEDGDVIELNPTMVQKVINGKSFGMYGYNGQIPGPMIKARQGSSITVHVKNNIDMPTTIHWHGLRHNNKDDGVPDITQEPIKPNGTFTYTVRFPDEGIYWYHPHVREDLQQDLGLYGNILVQTTADDAYSPTNSEEILILDDIADTVPSQQLFSLMGRFGSTMLINGETSYNLTVQRGEVIRFYLTNVANTRTFRIRIDGGSMKLVGSDIGRYEKEQWVDTITIAPAERTIVDVLFEDDGQYNIQHESPVATYDLGSVTVTSNDVDTSYEEEFNTLKTHTDVIADIDSYRKYFDAPIDKTLKLDINMSGMNHKMMDSTGSPELMQETHTADGIEWPAMSKVEWEDTMPMMNSMSNEMNTEWKLIDTETGEENMDIHWQFKKGDVVKIRIVNDPDSAHPMQHPIHLHGQRFLVLDVNGKRQQNLAWKDTVLVPSGQTTDILVDMSNPGDWMMHCHIAEHLTNGMMGMFTVSE